MRALIKTASLTWDLVDPEHLGDDPQAVAVAIAARIKGGGPLPCTIVNGDGSQRAVVFGAYEYVSVEG